MNDHISRQAALDEIDKNRQTLLSLGMDGAEHVLAHYGRRVIEGLPTIDVPDRKVGKWYEWSFTAFDGCTVWHRACSVCGYKRDDDNPDKDTNFCPHCGAKMERSEE